MIHCLNRLTNALQPDIQPLTRAQVSVVADARIDGRAALVDHLRARGEDVSLDSGDAALILASYLTWGERCIEYLIGDFSFIVWDDRAKKLFAARDHIGKRSLYYAQTRDALIISNELRPLRLLPDLNLDLDPVYIADFLALGEGFWLDRTATPFAAIRRLDRGHLLIFEGGALSIRPYWIPPVETPPLRYRREEETLEHFRSAFREAVRDRLRADRVVLTLSGGMDSSTVTAIAVDLIRNGEASAQFTAITTSYSRPDFQDPEEAYSRSIAERLGFAEHHVIRRVESPRLLLPYVHIANAIRPMLMPDMSRHYLERLASLGQVTFFGHLGDSLGGNLPLARALPHMQLARFSRAYFTLWRAFGKRPNLGSGALSRLLRRGQARRAEAYPFPTWMNPDFVRQFAIRERWEQYWSGLANLEEGRDKVRNPYLLRTVADYDHYSYDEFAGVDFVPSDAVDPYGDVRVLDLLFRLDPLPWFHKKYLQRQLMRGLLPSEVLNRPKQVFGDLTGYLLGLPESAWIDRWIPSGPLQAFVERSRIPTITGKHARMMAGQLIHLRPLMLDLWLRGEQDILRQQLTDTHDEAL
ncbi:MAG: asparagine synthetase B [Chloroflexi bacterium]|nr:asparagine synthetase B [Chloroflexota bacterium]